MPNHWGDGEPLSPEEHGDTPGSQMSGTTELLGDPEILTNDCTAPMGIAFPTAMIVPAPNVPLTRERVREGSGYGGDQGDGHWSAGAETAHGEPPEANVPEALAPGEPRMVARRR